MVERGAERSGVWRVGLDSKDADVCDTWWRHYEGLERRTCGMRNKTSTRRVNNKKKKGRATDVVIRLTLLLSPSLSIVIHEEEEKKKRQVEHCGGKREKAAECEVWGFIQIIWTSHSPRAGPTKIAQRKKKKKTADRLSSRIWF